MSGKPRKKKTANVGGNASEVERYPLFQQVTPADLDRKYEAMGKLPDLESGASVGGFDPWTQSEQSAYAIQESQSSWVPWTRSPLAQWATAQNVKYFLRPRIEAGDHAAILEAVNECASRGLVMPLWLAREYMRRYGAFTLHEVQDLNEAFGVQPQKRVTVNRKRREIEAMKAIPRVVAEVFAESPTKWPIGRDLWEEVGRRIGMSGGKVEKVYQDMRSEGLGLTAAEIRDQVSSGRPAD